MQRERDHHYSTSDSLQDSDALLRTMIENLPGGAAFVVDSDLRYRLADGEALAAAGFKPEDFIGRTIFEVLSPDLAANYEPLYRQALAGKPFEHEHYSHDRWYISRGTPLCSANGEIYGVLVVSYDITDRKRVEDERKRVEANLRESEARLKAVANLVPDLLWDSEPDGSTNWYNQRWMEYTGQTLEQAIGWGWIDAIHPDDREGSARRYREAVEQGMLLQQEHRIRRHDGAYRWFVVKASPLKDESGKVIKMYGAATDIHDRKQAEDALRESEARLAADLVGMQRLYELYSRLATETDLKVALDEILAAACEFTKTDRGCIQLVSDDGERLEMFAWRGYSDDSPFINYFRYEGFRQGCDVARAQRQRFIIEDTVGYPGLEGTQAGAVADAEGIRATQSTPMISRNGEALGVLSTQFRQPHRPSDGELRLIDLLAWVAANFVERHRANAALRESEAKYRTLFESMAEGFCSIEVLYDADGQPVDHRILEANLAFERHTGLTNARGRLASELMPGVEHFWTDLYARVVATGKSERLEQYSPAFDRWFDVEVSRIGDRSLHRVVVIFQDVTERKRAEDALRESEARYRTLFNSIDEGFVIAEVIYDSSGQAVDILYLEANPAASRLTGVPDYSQRRIREIAPDVESYWIEIYDRVARTGVSERAEQYTAALNRWYDFYVFPIEAAPGQSRRVAVTFQDITDRKQAEAQLRRAAEMDAFRVRLLDALRPLSDSVQIQAEACRVLGEQLGVDRAYYAEVNEAENYTRINQNYLRGDSPSLVCTLPLTDYGWVLPYLQRGETVVMPDIKNSDIVPVGDRAAMAAIKVAAHISHPLIKGGALVGALNVTEPKPRQWSEWDIELVRETADRIWATIERARVEAELRESEEKYRSLFNSIDAGFCIFEMLYNEAGEAIDFRYIETNPAFERQTGRRPQPGQTMRELFPEAEDMWLNDYAEVARTGQSKRFIDHHKDLDRWFNVFVFPTSNGKNQLAALFSDVTDEKRAEVALRANEERQAFLLKLSDAIRPLTDPVAIQGEAARVLGEHLGAGRTYYGEIDYAREVFVVRQDYIRDDAPSVVGLHPFASFGPLLEGLRKHQDIVFADTQTDPRIADADRPAYAAFSLRSVLTVPLVKAGVAVSGIAVVDAVPRRWTSDEAALVREVAARTWDAVERAKTEAALRTSEEKYRSLFNLMDEGFCIIEKVETDAGQPSDFRYLTVNPAFERHTGLRNVVGKTLRQFVPNVEQPIIDRYDTVARTGEPQQFLDYVSDLDIWIEAEVFPTQKPGQIAVLFSNVSELKRAEAQVQHAAEMDAFRVRLSDALRSLSDPGMIQAAACRVLGEHLNVDWVVYSELDWERRVLINAQDYYWGDSRRDDLPSLIGEYEMSVYPVHMEAWQSGRSIVVSDTENDSMLSEGERVGLTMYGIRAALSTPLIKNETVVVVIGVLSSAPRQWAAEDIALVEETADRTWNAVQRARAEAALRESEIQRIREQAAREEERQRAEALAELDRAKTLFFSNVSHEFRTPLTLLLAPLQEVLNDSTLPSAHRERLELAHRNSLRLLKLVNTLLDFSRIEAGRIEAVYEPTDLARFTADLASVFRSAIERAGLQLIVDCPPLPQPVFVDREMWEKIVLNLLSNALKFTFEGEIRVSLHANDSNQAILQIQDTGTGIAPEHLPHLFERFYQVRGSQARSREGSGIGLALVQELVRLHGGTIEVSSTVGEGTCFTITLLFGTDHLLSRYLQLSGTRRLHFEGEPVRTLASTAIGAAVYVEEAQRWLSTQENREQTLENAEAQTAQTIASQFPTERIASAHVLLVDDNADMREYLTRILSEHVQVETVADGATALTMAHEQVPDLILSDVMMPGLNGFELLQALRADPRTREVPIILLSARAGEEAIVEGLDAGADDYLIKPFSAQELVSRVNAHLQMAQLRGEALQAARSTIRNRDEFISVVSHELNTPLVSILGWTRLLRVDSPSPAMLTKALDIIERNATLQAKLVQDLLDISRITAGKLSLSPQPIELESVIEAAIATVAQTAAANEIDLVWHNHAMHNHAIESVIVMGDGDRLQQVVCNLLTNAIKFTPALGSIKLELSVSDGDYCSDYFGEYSNHHSIDGAYAEIRVSDTGIGIAGDCLPYIFDRFRQARDADAAKGLGLGLTIARHIVELHQGTIHARSAGEGQGATFIVRLPLLAS